MPVRVMRPADLASVWHLQSHCYPREFWEEPALLAERLARCPDTAWVVDGEFGICAYLVSYPTQLGALAALSAPFEPDPDPNCLYLHDLSVGAEHQGQGFARQLLEQALIHARQQRLDHSALVSVQDSGRFWQALGFQPQPLSGTQRTRALASYPGNAVYMSRPL